MPSGYFHPGYLALLFIPCIMCCCAAAAGSSVIAISNFQITGICFRSEATVERQMSPLLHHLHWLCTHGTPITPTPFFFLRMHHLLTWSVCCCTEHCCQPSWSTPTAVHSLRCTGSPIRAEGWADWWRGCVISSTVLSCILNPLPSAQKGQQEIEKGGGGGEGKSSLPQDGGTFRSVVGGGREGCRHKGEETQHAFKHLLKAAVGLPPSSSLSSFVRLHWPLRQNPTPVFFLLGDLCFALHQPSHHVWSDASEWNPNSHHWQDHTGCQGNHLSLQLSCLCRWRVAVPSRAQWHLAHTRPRAGSWR